MTFKPSVQSFVGPNTTNAIASQCAIDWLAEKIYILTNLSGGYLNRFGILSGVQEQAASVAAYSGTIVDDTPLGLDTKGNLYLVDPGGNFGGVRQIAGETLASVAQWGLHSTFDNYPLGIPYPGQIAGVRKGNAAYLICGGLGGGAAENNRISILSCSPLGISGTETSLPTVTIQVLPGIPGAGVGYAICRSVDLVNTLLYGIDAATGVVSLIGNIAPTDIDPEWTLVQPAGACIDQTDGNIIAYVLGQTGRTTPFYTIKINAQTGAIIWKVPFGSDLCSAQMAFSQIKNGRFATLNFGTVTVINTSDGSYTQFSEGLDGISNFEQCFDDSSGAIVLVGSYNNEGSGSPTPLNATPNSFSGWMALYVIEAFVPPYVPGGRVAHLRIWGDYP